MLSAEQRTTFEARGLLHLPGFADARAVGALRERIVAYLREQRIVPDGAPPGFTVHASRTASVLRAHDFEALWGAQASALLDELLGRDAWQRPKDAGQLLMLSVPLHGTVWALPHNVWHLDYPAPAALRSLPGMQLFVCLDRVERRGGATLVACGTHRLIDALRRDRPKDWPGRSADVRRRLRARVPWLAELFSLREGGDREARFMREHTLGGDVPLQVVELVGEPGDVYAMHPWLLHAPSPCCGDRPRMVVTQRVHAARR